MAENKPRINPARQPEQLDYRAEIVKIAEKYANTDANQRNERRMIDEGAWDYIIGLRIPLLERTELWSHYCEIKLKKSDGLEKRV
jgi:hypothetical protein